MLSPSRAQEFKGSPQHSLLKSSNRTSVHNYMGTTTPLGLFLHAGNRSRLRLPQVRVGVYAMRTLSVPHIWLKLAKAKKKQTGLLWLTNPKIPEISASGQSDPRTPWTPPRLGLIHPTCLSALTPSLGLVTRLSRSAAAGLFSQQPSWGKSASFLVVLVKSQA